MINEIDKWKLRKNSNFTDKDVFSYEEANCRRWRFMYKYNPSKIEIVTQTFDNKKSVKGKPFLVDYLKSIGELDSPREFNLKYIKKIKRISERSQTNLRIEN